MTAATTLLALSALVGRLTYRSRTIERIVDGEPVVLVEDGRVMEDAARAERISESELAQALRAHGVETLDDVRLAVVEANGNISVVKTKE